MLRPSRPMIRPFMSSDGSSTSETVVSAAWLAATRWSASATRLRARRFASVRASSSIWRTRRASSWRISSSERSSRYCLRLARRSSRRSARARELALLRLLQLLLELLECVLAVGDALLAARELGQPPLDLLLLRVQRAPRLEPPGSPLLRPPPRSARAASPPPRAPRPASRRIASASRSASASSCLARAATPCRAGTRRACEWRRRRRQGRREIPITYGGGDVMRAPRVSGPHAESRTVECAKREQWRRRRRESCQLSASLRSSGSVDVERHSVGFGIVEFGIRLCRQIVRV